MAGQAGLEPATVGFGDRCSTSWATDLPKNNGAHDRTWTGDLFLTKEVLYRLSYMGVGKSPLEVLERETGLEPATLSLEGWRSGQLSYSRPAMYKKQPFSTKGIGIAKKNFPRIDKIWKRESQVKENFV